MDQSGDTGNPDRDFALTGNFTVGYREVFPKTIFFLFSKSEP